VPIPLSYRNIIVLDETTLESVHVQEIDDGRIVWVPVSRARYEKEQLDEWAIDGVEPVSLDSLSWETVSPETWMDEWELGDTIFSGIEDEKEYDHRCDHDDVEDDVQVDWDSEVVPFSDDTLDNWDEIWNHADLWTTKVDTEWDGGWEGWNEVDESDT